MVAGKPRACKPPAAASEARAKLALIKQNEAALPSWFPPPASEVLPLRPRALTEFEHAYVRSFKRLNGGSFCNVFCLGQKRSVYADALERRGWVYNPDPTDKLFLLKITIRSSELRDFPVAPWQLVNHIQGVNKLTTKAGLSDSLAGAQGFLSVAGAAGYAAPGAVPARVLALTPEHFFPNSFNLREKQQKAALGEHFVLAAAVAVLRRVACGEPVPPPVSVLAARAALCYISSRETVGPHPAPLGADEAMRVCNFLTEKKVEKGVVDEFLPAISSIARAPRRSVGLPRQEAKWRRKRDTQARREQTPAPPAPSDAETLLHRLEALSPFFGLCGKDNLWIIKPGGLSRGRGISLSDSLRDLQQDEARALIVQKYVERPLLIHSHKFDIRQWVVVTSLFPLEIWYFHRFYVRFASCPYASGAETIDKLYVHLTNNSIQKASATYGANPEVFGVGNMWDSGQFRDHIERHTARGATAWAALLSKMKNVVISSALAARNLAFQGAEDARRQLAFELFGYDFLIDEDLQPWLLEVNSAPTVQQNTPTMCSLVPEMVDGLIELILAKDWYRPDARGVGAEVSGWELIHRENLCADTISRAGAKSLYVSGAQVSVPPLS